MRRNLAMTHRYLNPVRDRDNKAPGARRKAALAEAVGLVAAKDPTLAVDADEARRVAVRFVFNQAVEKDRLNWVGGVPTAVELTAIRRRVADQIGLSIDEISAALRGHPMPQTVG